jgi:hypothetical protein
MARDKPVPPQEGYGVATTDPWLLNEKVRRRRLREQGQRTRAENLEEGLALIRFVSGFTGAARK